MVLVNYSWPEQMFIKNAFEGNIDQVEKYLKNKGNPNLTINGQPIVHLLIYEKSQHYFAIAKMLLDYGNINKLQGTFYNFFHMDPI